jgi:hypothetical protein
MGEGAGKVCGSVNAINAARGRQGQMARNGRICYACWAMLRKLLTLVVIAATLSATTAFAAPKKKKVDRHWHGYGFLPGYRSPERIEWERRHARGPSYGYGYFYYWPGRPTSTAARSPTALSGPAGRKRRSARSGTAANSLSFRGTRQKRVYARLRRAMAREPGIQGKRSM